LKDSIHSAQETRQFLFLVIAQLVSQILFNVFIYL